MFVSMRHESRGEKSSYCASFASREKVVEIPTGPIMFLFIQTLHIAPPLAEAKALVSGEHLLLTCKFFAYCSPACRSESSRKRGMDRSGFSNTATFTFWLKPLKGKLLFVFRERFRGSGSSRERVLCMFSAHPLFRGSASSRKRAGLRTRGLHHAKVAIFSEQRLPLIYRPDPIISSNNFLIFLLFIRFIFFLSQNP